MRIFFKNLLLTNCEPVFLECTRSAVAREDAEEELVR